LYTCIPFRVKIKSFYVYLFKIILYCHAGSENITAIYLFSNKPYLYSVVYFFIVTRISFHKTKLWAWNSKGESWFFRKFDLNRLLMKGGKLLFGSLLSNVNLKWEVFCMQKICNAFNTLYLYTNIIFGLKTMFPAKFHYSANKFRQTSLQISILITN